LKVLVHFFEFLCWVFIIDKYFSLWRIVICKVLSMVLRFYSITIYYACCWYL